MAKSATLKSRLMILFAYTINSLIVYTHWVTAILTVPSEREGMKRALFIHYPYSLGGRLTMNHCFMAFLQLSGL